MASAHGYAVYSSCCSLLSSVHNFLSGHECGTLYKFALFCIYFPFLLLKKYKGGERETLRANSLICC